jgi:hypothetical protein
MRAVHFVQQEMATLYSNGRTTGLVVTLGCAFEQGQCSASAQYFKADAGSPDRMQSGSHCCGGIGGVHPERNRASLLTAALGSVAPGV